MNLNLVINLTHDLLVLLFDLHTFVHTFLILRERVGVWENSPIVENDYDVAAKCLGRCQMSRPLPNALNYGAQRVKKMTLTYS